MMMPKTLALLGLLLTAMSARADDFTVVHDASTFLATIGGRELRLPLMKIALKVMPDGSISGSAMGWNVSGSWAWEDGYFCRRMDWSGSDVPYDCQLVEVRGGDEMRFTVDRGNGKSALFKLR